jgi:DNA-binding MarR family transcriptional regulator
MSYAPWRASDTTGGNDRMNSREVYQAWVAIGQAAISLERAVDARLRPWNLNQSQGAALLVLAQHGPQRMSHLARFLLQQTQTTTDLVDRLERRGLVRRIRHETDRRVVLVEITEEGQSLIGEVGDAVWSVGNDAFRTINGNDLRRFTESVRHIRDAAAEVGGVPADHLSYAEERLNIAPLALQGNGEAAG